MDETQGLVRDATTRIFQDLGNPQTINNAEDDAWRDHLWSALEDAGLTTAWVSDELGGAGAGIGAGFAVLRVAGEFAAPVALAETLLANWLLEQGRLVLPGGTMSVAPTRRRDTIFLTEGKLAGTAEMVPFGTEVNHLAVLASGKVALVNASDCVYGGGVNLAGEPLNRVNFDGVTPLEISDLSDGVDQRAMLLMGAAARAMQMAGALQTVLEVAVQYAEERIAFGRPIGKFQAVQHNLARLGEEAAAAIAIANSTATASRIYDPGMTRDCFWTWRQRKSAWAKPPDRAVPLAIRPLAHLDLPRNIFCIALCNACGLGGTISITRRFGPRNWAAGSPLAVAMAYGST